MYLVNSRLNDSERAGIASFLSLVLSLESSCLLLVFLVVSLFSTCFFNVFFFMLRYSRQLQRQSDSLTICMVFLVFV
jgi:hypothetical protein